MMTASGFAEEPIIVLNLKLSQDSVQTIDTLSVQDSSRTKTQQDIVSDLVPPDTDVRELSLEGCIELALEHNRNLKLFRLSENSARIQLEMAESRFLPSASISGGRNESRNDDLGYVITKHGLSSGLSFWRALETGGAVSLSVGTNTSESSNNPGITNYYTNVGLSVSQPLMAGAGIEVNMIPIKRAQAYAKISLFHITQGMINLITVIESQYWDLILVYEDYRIQLEALQRARDLLEVNKSLIESGRLASQEIVQAESDVANSEISVAGAENSILNTQIALQAQLDLEEHIWLQPTTKMTFHPVQVRIEDCLAAAYVNRPDWLIHELYLEIERMNLILSKNRNRYTLGCYASVASDANSDREFWATARDAFNFQTLTWNVGLSFNFPFNKQVLKNGYQLQQLSYDSQALYMAELKENIRIAVENAVRHVEYSLKQVNLALRAKELAERKLELEQEKMKVGRSSNFQVISYQRDLTNAQNGELRAIATYLKALGALQQTMGTTLKKWGIEIERE
ncbi:TolC family protein [candidate division KSB1 bacterium]|nr:TolC family protein [candidate division KSB1 bacterium]